MRIANVPVYLYHELTTAAQSVARSWWFECFQFYDEFSIDATVLCASSLLGIDTSRDRITYSVGDHREYLAISGSYQYRPQSVRAITTEFPTDTVLRSIAGNLTALQRRYFYRLSAGLYTRLGMQAVDVHDTDGNAPRQATVVEMTEQLMAFSRWSLGVVRDEYNHQTSDEYAAECIVANEYEFTADGKRFRYQE